MIQINAFYSDRIRIELIFLNIHFKISKSWPIQYSLSIMPFITGSFGENFRSSDLDSRAEACPISNDGSSIATYLIKYFSNIFDHKPMNHKLWYVRFFQIFKFMTTWWRCLDYFQPIRTRAVYSKLKFVFWHLFKKMILNFISG